MEASPAAASVGGTAAGVRVAIVGGCGHVGLPLGLALADVGHTVMLVDSSEERTRCVREGKMPFFEASAEDVLRRVRDAGRLNVTTDVAGVAEADVVIITIGTPVDEYLDPKIAPFDRAMNHVLDAMRPGQLLVLRSTVFPGVTDRLARQLEERGLDVDLAYCPERLAQGLGLEELRSLPHLVSGMTPRAAERAAQLFGSLGTRTIELEPIEAELAKLFANAYRYINFAISNQFYMMAERFDADFGRIYDALTTDYARMRGFARSGFAGGPCLLKDTMQLAAFNHNNFVLGQSAMMINEGLPSFVVERLKQRRDLGNETVAILGMAFKGDSDDPRDSLAYKLRKVLSLACQRVICTDPYIEDPEFVPLETALAEADVLVIGAPHSQYRNLQTDKPILDVFYAVEPRT